MIRAGGRVTLLHQIFQRTGLTPTEVYSRSPWERAFLLASMSVRLEDDKKGGADNGQ